MFPFISIYKLCDSGAGLEQTLWQKFAKYFQVPVATVAVTLLLFLLLLFLLLFLYGPSFVMKFLRSFLVCNNFAEETREEDCWL